MTAPVRPRLSRDCLTLETSHAVRSGSSFQNVADSIKNCLNSYWGLCTAALVNAVAGNDIQFNVPYDTTRDAILTCGALKSLHKS